MVRNFICLSIYLLVECFVPTKVIRVHNKDKPWFNDDCMTVFYHKQEVHHQWTPDCSPVNWDEFVHYQRIANVVYTKARYQFSVRSLTKFNVSLEHATVACSRPSQ